MEQCSSLRYEPVYCNRGQHQHFTCFNLKCISLLFTKTNFYSSMTLMTQAHTSVVQNQRLHSRTSENNHAVLENPLCFLLIYLFQFSKWLKTSDLKSVHSTFNYKVLISVTLVTAIVIVICCIKLTENVKE